MKDIFLGFYLRQLNLLGPGALNLEPRSVVLSPIVSNESSR